MTDNRKFWQRKTWWGTVFAVLIPILNRAFDLEMDITEVTASITPIIIYVMSEQWKKK